MHRKTQLFASVELMLEALFTGEVEELTYKEILNIASKNPHVKVIANPGQFGEPGLVIVDRYGSTLDIRFSQGDDKAHVVSYTRGFTETKQAFIDSCVVACDMSLVDVIEQKSYTHEPEFHKEASI